MRPVQKSPSLTVVEGWLSTVVFAGLPTYLEPSVFRCLFVSQAGPGARNPQRARRHSDSAPRGSSLARSVRDGGETVRRRATPRKAAARSPGCPPGRHGACHRSGHSGLAVNHGAVQHPARPDPERAQLPRVSGFRRRPRWVAPFTRGATAPRARLSRDGRIAASCGASHRRNSAPRGKASKGFTQMHADARRTRRLA